MKMMNKISILKKMNNFQSKCIRTEPVERGDTRFFTSATSDGIEN